MRPYCREFLKRMSKIYEIILFTSSDQQYAKALISQIDTHKYISQILSMEYCLQTNNGLFIKDLRILKNR